VQIRRNRTFSIRQINFAIACGFDNSVLAESPDNARSPITAGIRNNFPTTPLLASDAIAADFAA
jgi:hypothetical protein